MQNFCQLTRAFLSSLSIAAFLALLPSLLVVLLPVQIVSFSASVATAALRRAPLRREGQWRQFPTPRQPRKGFVPSTFLVCSLTAIAPICQTMAALEVTSNPALFYLFPPFYSSIAPLNVSSSSSVLQYAPGGGGAAYLLLATVAVRYTVRSCNLVGNSAVRGGAIFIDERVQLVISDTSADPSLPPTNTTLSIRSLALPLTGGAGVEDTVLEHRRVDSVTTEHVQRASRSLPSSALGGVFDSVFTDNSARQARG